MTISRHLLLSNRIPDLQYDGNDIVVEIGGGSAVNATVIRTLNIDEPLARITSSGFEYYHADALGSVFALTDAYGNSTTSYTYDPFGNTTQTGISSNPFQYTGRENDGTGLYYYRARYYSPSLQRFISEDPIGLNGGINFYAYVLNNPLKFVDSTGTINNSGYGTHFPPPFPNGNYQSTYNNPQDNICTIQGDFFRNKVGQIANSIPCVLKCCQVHDNCYQTNGCNESSWRGNYYGWDLPCQRCNSAVVSCISSAVITGCASGCK